MFSQPGADKPAGRNHSAPLMASLRERGMYKRTADASAASGGRDVRADDVPHSCSRHAIGQDCIALRKPSNVAMVRRDMVDLHARSVHFLERSSIEALTPGPGCLTRKCSRHAEAGLGSARAPASQRPGKRKLHSCGRLRDRLQLICLSLG
jgi:hypothetical protein